MKKMINGATFARILIVLLSIVALFPFYNMIIMSTYKAEDLMTGVRFIPGKYLLTNLKTIFSTDFHIFYFNSIYITSISTLGTVLVSALAGFGFAKYSFKGRTVLFTIVLSTIMIPVQLNLIGFVMEMKFLGFPNSHFGLIVPTMARAYFIFWMTSYIKSSVPNEILESARIDGASEFRIFSQIVFPILRPANITVFLLAFLDTWNQYLTPLVLINSEEKYTIPQAITILSTQYRTDYAASILALALATLPMIIFFSFGSKYLVLGLSKGSVKG